MTLRRVLVGAFNRFGGQPSPARPATARRTPGAGPAVTLGCGRISTVERLSVTCWVSRAARGRANTYAGPYASWMRALG